jgi:hypothetical protein
MNRDDFDRFVKSRAIRWLMPVIAGSARPFRANYSRTSRGCEQRFGSPATDYPPNFRTRALISHTVAPLCRIIPHGSLQSPQLAGILANSFYSIPLPKSVRIATERPVARLIRSLVDRLFNLNSWWDLSEGKRALGSWNLEEFNGTQRQCNAMQRLRFTSYVVI